MGQQADNTAEALNRRLRPALMAFFRRRIGHYGEAEDLTHEVLLRVAQRGAWIDADRPDAYVFQIAANLLHDRYKRNVLFNRYQTEAQQGFGVGRAVRVRLADELREFLGKGQGLVELPGRVGALASVGQQVRQVLLELTRRIRRTGHAQGVLELAERLGALSGLEGVQPGAHVARELGGGKGRGLAGAQAGVAQQ